MTTVKFISNGIFKLAKYNGSFPNFNSKYFSTEPPEPLTKNDVKLFTDFFPKMRDNILSHQKMSELQPVDQRFFKQMMDYSLPFGWRRTPLIALSIYRSVMKPEDVNERNLEQILYLSWMIQMTQWSYQIFDDYLDQSRDRDNKPCWYRVEDNGGLVGFDSMLLCSFARVLMREHFHDHPRLHNLLEVFDTVDCYTILGQRMENIKVPIEEMTMDRWTLVAKYKTGFHFAAFPITAAMHATNTFDVEKYDNMKHLMIECGTLIQVYNDYLDTYPMKVYHGPDCCDIETGKSSWLFLKAKEMCDAKQLEMIQEHYSKNEPESIKIIQQLYGELDLKEYGRKYLVDTYNSIIQRTWDLPQDYPRKALVNAFYTAFHGF